MRIACLSVLSVLLVPVAATASPLWDLGGDDFRRGTWALELDGAFIQPIRFSEDKFYVANFDAGYYIADGVGLSAEVTGYFADQPNDDTGILGAGVLLRWHFLMAERYSLFVDGGMGFSIAEDEVPDGGTHFNYTPHGGVGATIRLRDDVHLIGGARFFHLSNGNLHGRDQNPSQDGVQYYLGVVFEL